MLLGIIYRDDYVSLFFNNQTLSVLCNLKFTHSNFYKLNFRELSLQICFTQKYKEVNL